MKHIFVGDIHGRVDHVEAALAMPGRKIFVGDFVDSFSRSTDDMRRCLDLVLASEADILYGNHEMSYLMPKRHLCSGWRAETAALMAHYRKQIEARFVPFPLLGDLLVTHAGLTKALWDNQQLNRDILTQVLAEGFADSTSFFHRIGFARGGLDRYSGPLWCDYRHEFEPVPGLRQVFGHTRGVDIRQDHPGNWCIDCLEKATSPQFLELEVA